MSIQSYNRRVSHANIALLSRGFSKIPLASSHQTLIRSISNINGTLSILQSSQEVTFQPKVKKDISVVDILKDQSHITNEAHMK